MRRLLRAAVMCLGCGTLAGCTTRVLEVRTGPSARLDARRTVVVADVAVLQRDATEDAIAKRLPGAVPSYLLPNRDEIRHKAILGLAGEGGLGPEWDALVFATVVASHSRKREYEGGHAGGTPAGMGLAVGEVPPNSMNEGGYAFQPGAVVPSYELRLDVSVVRSPDGKELFGTKVLVERTATPESSALDLAPDAAARAAREIAKAGIFAARRGKVP